MEEEVLDEPLEQDPSDDDLEELDEEGFGGEELEEGLVV